MKEKLSNDWAFQALSTDEQFKFAATVNGSRRILFVPVVNVSAWLVYYLFIAEHKLSLFKEVCLKNAMGTKLTLGMSESVCRENIY